MKQAMNEENHVLL
jgi:hypothetical protein